MNREIKFRAWDNVNKEMVYPASGIFTQGHRSHELLWKFEDVMQYTGLKDSAGKEIYEGDIVEVDGLQYKIMFRGLGFWFVGSDNEGWAPYNPSVYRITVIGNIFENPELL